MGRLKPDEYELLAACVAAHAPALLPLIGEIERRSLSNAEGNALREAVGIELMANGFREDWEPNAHGLRCEDLIDVLVTVMEF